MAEGEKPYRRYKGGRVKGRVPLNRGKKPAQAAKSATPGGPRKPRRWGRWVALTLVGLLVFLLLWGVLGYLSFARGVDDANARLPRGAERQLVRESGSMLSDPSTILVIGTDGGKAPGRQDARRSDSLLLIRTEPSRHRISYLSIPRDLRVDIPGYGSGKINAANQFGGPALTIATVRALTGLKIDHVVIFDFDGFRELIDAIGGVEIDVPRRIQSNAFDCPYKPARCESWDGWRFAKGKQHMDGRRALVYSRIRTNELNPADNDVTRVGRQQAVADAVGDKIASVGTFFKLPFVGDSIAAPLVTDLSAWELAQLGWVRFRADSGSSLHCRLGGEPSFDGESVLLGSEDNVDVIAMFLRVSAPLAPRKGELYAPGCTRRARLVAGGFLLAGRGLLGRLVGGLLGGRAGVALFRGGLSPALAVVGRVEAGAFEVDGDREQDLLDGPGAARRADLDGRVAHLLEDLERVPVGTTVFVDGH